MLDLKDTVKYMCSDDYAERFKGEYQQLSIRCTKLENMLKKYKNMVLKNGGEVLNFIPNTPYEILDAQLEYMKKYLTVLEVRANYENISLN